MVPDGLVCEFEGGLEPLPLLQLPPHPLIQVAAAAAPQLVLQQHVPPVLLEQLVLVQQVPDLLLCVVVNRRNPQVVRSA